VSRQSRQSFATLRASNQADTCDPKLVSPAYTPDSVWRNRDQFFTGRDAIEKFLTDKWAKEHNYRLRKELFAFQDNKMYAQMRDSSADVI